MARKDSLFFALFLVFTQTWAQDLFDCPQLPTPVTTLSLSLSICFSLSLTALSNAISLSRSLPPTMCFACNPETSRRSWPWAIPSRPDSACTASRLTTSSTSWYDPPLHRYLHVAYSWFLPFSLFLPHTHTQSLTFRTIFCSTSPIVS